VSTFRGSGPIALPVGIWLPDVLGGGSNLIDTAEHARVGLGMLCLLFVAKMLFTSTSFGSGAPGGIFMPILAVGSLAGGICGEVLHRIGDLPSDAVAVFAACVMTGTLAASVKTPITSILLAVEMSGTLTHMLPVAAVAFIALLVSDLHTYFCSPHGVYFPGVGPSESIARLWDAGTSNSALTSPRMKMQRHP
jgi:H+/Cl- antiporter ClcA